MLRTITLAAAAVVALAGVANAQNWKPEKPVTIIVPWAAGGSTDQVTRIAAAELEKAFGQKFVVVNQPGASGSIGTRNVMTAPADGYTWLANAAKDLGTYPVSGLVDTRITDWKVYLHIANASVISVGNNSPYKTIQDLVAAMKAKPGQVSVGTAGVNSSGHTSIEAFTKALGLTYKHVTYDGGNPAVIATVAGEVEVTPQLAVEQAQMIRGKRLRPLAVLSDKPLELAGYGSIPPVTASIKEFKPDLNYFGMYLAKGTPDNIVMSVNKVWDDVIMKSEALKKYAADNGSVFDPSYGEKAVKIAMPAIQSAAWLLHAGGSAKVSPDTVGIPKP